MEQQIQTIREACIKANPSILYLKFGCMVKVDSDEQPLLNEDIIRYIECSPNGLQEIRIVGYSSWIKVSHISKIIGRPIRLADVLLAMKSQEDRSWTDQASLIVGAVGDTKWNLFKDDLRSQSKETVEFIYNLLKS